MVNQRPIFTVENASTVYMTMDGIKYSGTVAKNGRLIQWSDGDEWVREGANTSSPHVPMQIEPADTNKATASMGETPPISGDEDEKTLKKKKNKLKKKKGKKITDGDAKKEIATRIKKWLREQDSSHKINREDFKSIAKKCTEKMWKIYQTKRKQKAGLMPKDFLSKRRSGKVIALINKYIEQSKKRSS